MRNVSKAMLGVLIPLFLNISFASVRVIYTAFALGQFDRPRFPPSSICVVDVLHVCYNLLLSLQFGLHF